MKSLITALLFSISCSTFAQPDELSLIGSWEGPLTVSRDEMNLALTFSVEDGVLKAALVSAGLGIYGMPADHVTLEGLKLQASFSRLGAEFTGRLRLNRSEDEVFRIEGDWFQSAEMVPLTLLPVSEPSF